MTASLFWLVFLRTTRRTAYRWAAYSLYLASSTWRRRADACLSRAGHLCEECSAAQAVHAHHTSYALAGCEPKRHLRALCRRCHSDVHGRTIR